MCLPTPAYSVAHELEGVGLIWYPVLGVGSALLTIAAPGPCRCDWDITAERITGLSRSNSSLDALGDDRASRTSELPAAVGAVR